jgi:glycosyltransferase involved in cell wall biosynthesis
MNNLQFVIPGLLLLVPIIAYSVNKLFLGRIDPIKRIDWVLDLAGLIDVNIRLVVAGGVQDSKTEAYLRSLKQKADKDPIVIFTGPVAGREKAELFGNCLLFLAPSAGEGLPITVLEAAAYGKCQVRN